MKRNYREERKESMEEIKKLPDLEDMPKTDEEKVVLENKKKIIYFLSPTDLRPPSDTDDASILKNDENQNIPKIIPEDTNKKDILKADFSGDSKFIQIGAYSNFLVLFDTYNKIKKESSRYPVCYTEEKINGKSMYKLLVGPLLPAETKTVLNSLRKTSFPDAFMFNDDKQAYP